MHRRVAQSDLITYTPSKKVSQLQVIHPRTGALELDKATVVISIDGACRGNGTPNARAGWGVYVRPGSPHNAYGRLPQDQAQTSNRAEIEALSQALRIILNNLSKDISLMEYYIVSDSLNLVRSMSEWMQDWIDDGGYNSNGKPVAHYQVLKDIYDRVEDLTYGDDGGLVFKFWHVPREMNKEADALANKALDE